jgi:hypothetical protein
MDLPALTALLTYRLDGPAEDFAAAAGQLAVRVRCEGHPGVLTYRFFADAATGSARAVVDYRDPEAWLGHHDIVTGWPEMAALRRAATLTEVCFLGRVTPAILDWMARSGLAAEVRHGFGFAAGFVRD